MFLSPPLKSAELGNTYLSGSPGSIPGASPRALSKHSGTLWGLELTRQVLLTDGTLTWAWNARLPIWLWWRAPRVGSRMSQRGNSSRLSKCPLDSEPVFVGGLQENGKGHLLIILDSRGRSRWQAGARVCFCYLCPLLEIIHNYQSAYLQLKRGKLWLREGTSDCQ